MIQKRSSAVRARAEKQWREHGKEAGRGFDLAYEMAYYLEYGDFLEVVKRLSSPKAVMKQQFISGIMLGVFTALGLVIITAIMAAILGTVGIDAPNG